MSLDSPQFTKLLGLIKDSFRVRQNQPPLFVNVGRNLGRGAAPQHQMIFGRRGSGKSCLLISYLNSAPRSVYILADSWGGELLVSNWVYVLIGFASFSIKGLIFMFVFM